MRQASRRKYHYVYRITRFDGKYYIGIHSTDNIDDGYFGSGRRLRNSVKAHGKDVHVKEILEFHPDREAVKKREAELVNEECLNDPLCMNLCLGGGAGWDYLNDGSEKHRERCKQGGIAGCHAIVSYVQSEEGRSDSRVKMLRLHAEGKVKRHSFKGKQHTEKIRRLISESSVGKHSGERNSQFGSCWIHHLELKQNKKISKNEIALFPGWLPGRKMRFK